MELVFQPNQEYVITLKEITDLIGARHDKSMLKVEELAVEDGFGLMSKIDISVPRGNGATPQIISTYQFTKKQAIAVGARLNNTMLMKVINRLEELESQKPQFQIPHSYSEALRLAADLSDENIKLHSVIKQKDEVILAVADLNIRAGDISIGDFSKNLAIENLGRNNLFAWLKARGFLMMNTEPYQPYVERGYFVRKPSDKRVNGEVKYTTMLTAKGSVWLTKMLRAEFNLED